MSTPTGGEVRYYDCFNEMISIGNAVSVVGGEIVGHAGIVLDMALLDDMPMVAVKLNGIEEAEMIQPQHLRVTCKGQPLGYCMPTNEFSVEWETPWSRVWDPRTV